MSRVVSQVMSELLLLAEVAVPAEDGALLLVALQLLTSKPLTSRLFTVFSASCTSKIYSS